MTAGPHQGKTALLKTTEKLPCMLGRSRGKAFLGTRGISLIKDEEVSTTHGKFQMIGEKLFFVDVGSTNGTRIGEKQLVADVPEPVVSGMEIICGQTVVLVTIL